MDRLQQLLEERAGLLDELQTLLDTAEQRDDPTLSEQEQEQYDALDAQVQGLNERIERYRALQASMNDGDNRPAHVRERETQGPVHRGQAPAHHERPTQDTAESIMCRWIRTGDSQAEREFRQASAEEYRNLNNAAAEVQQAFREERASNDTGMNITTAADGGNLVPTGHYNRIIARRDEIGLRSQLNLLNVPGVGTTVNVPIDNEADGEFVQTGEMGDDNTTNVFDRDAPAVDSIAMTLVKYTKKIELTDELLLDNDSNLMQFLEQFVGRGLAKTDNNLIVTEALADGTAALTLDAAAAIGASEIPELIHLQAEGYEDGSVWIMRRATLGHIRQKTGDAFQFDPTPVGGGSRRQLWGFPLYTSQKAAAIGGGNKSLIFGNFAYMGVRQMPGLTLLRDPYTVDGKLLLKYYYRVDYEVLQAAAITYATHPTA